ncbi:MAG: endo-1,4-beta-xylanase [Patescibacteria group bacterium]
MRIPGFIRSQPLAVRLAIGIGALGLVALFFLNFPTFRPAFQPLFGVTFTPGQAESFGLDWKETYTALLDDLGVRHFRLVAYWDAIESARGKYFFDDLDYQLDELAKRNGKAVLAVGRKVPRWPECHDPSWLSAASSHDLESDIQNFVTALMERYRSHPAVEIWQVENEVTFPFGICPNMLGLDALSREIKLVRALDPSHPIMVTDGGEWSAWLPIGLYGDVLGVSLYREAYNNLFGHISFPVGPGWYQLRAAVLGAFGKETTITELQAEPWGKKAVQEMTVQEGLTLMPPEKLKKNIEFSTSVGFSRVTLWGAEWWYWLKTKGDDRIWEMMKQLF